MRFALEQRLPGAVDRVLDALLDPAFITALGELPDVDAPELLEQRRDGDTVLQRVRYRFTGSLSPAVTRVVDPHRLVWVEECTYDLAGKRATFRIVPEHYANRLKAGGRHRFSPADGGQATIRSVDGELTVSYPLVGRAVERAIVSGLERHLGVEGELLGRWLGPGALP